MKKVLQGEVDEPLLQLEQDFGCGVSPSARTGSVLASAAGRVTSESGEVKIWDFNSRQEVLTLSFSNKVSCVQFSPDGQRLATVSADSLKVWDVTDRPGTT